MPIVIERLERTLSRIGQTDDGPVRYGAFADLGSDLFLRMAVEELPSSSRPDHRQQEVLRTHQYVAKDVWNIETLFDRINWQRELWSSGQLDDGRWNVFTTADIDLFHVEFRSLFDYLSRLLVAVANKPGQVPKDASFERLSNWAGNADNRPSEKLGEDLVSVIKIADWFPLIRMIRNSTVHYGAETLVFYDKPRILFQTYNGGGRDKIIDLSELMYNSNVVDFELYAGVFYGYLIDYLEEVAKCVYLRLGLTRREGGTRHHNSGIATAKRWMEAVQQARQTASTTSEGAKPTRGTEPPS